MRFTKKKLKRKNNFFLTIIQMLFFRKVTFKF